MTDPRRWQLAQSLFLDALEREPEARDAWLARQCRDDPDTLHEVEKLLRGHAASETRLSDAIAKAAHDALTEGWTASTGQRIGAYEIVSPLGHGGMGSVYLAKRVDQVYKGQVAIKIVQRGMVTPDIAARFRLERQILAQLEHPNIARLLDGGTTADGLPYLVMEYIEGQPITEYCAARNLRLEQRLGLFRQVCAAVQFAHQRLIVHRDLKPTNILVTQDGVPKLLDFGIAKLLQPVAEMTVAKTRTHMAPMSPEFAAPEQLSGGPISTATDVYGLGVLLYLLLTGEHPFPIDSARPELIYQAIRESEPRLPSVALKVTDEHDVSRGTLRGDLDTIIMMALRKEPQRRYASVDQFADDLKCYLQGRPVRAHEDSWSYRGARFMRRNKGAMAVSVIIIAMLLGFLLRESGLRHAAEVARVAAGVEADKATAVSRFMRDMLKEANPWLASGREVTVVEALDAAARKLEEEDAELRQGPALRAALRISLAETYSGLGKYELATMHARRAFDLQRARLGDSHADTFLAEILLADQLQLREKSAEAETLYRNVLARATPLLGETHEIVITARAGLAAALKRLDKFEESEQLSLQVLAMLQSMGEEQSARAATYMHNLGTTYYSMGEFAKALRYYEQALAVRRGIHGDAHPGTQATLGNIATVHLRMGMAQQARDIFAQQITILEKVLGARHDETLEARHKFAATYFQEQNFPEAEKYLRRVTELRREALGSDHPDTLSSLGSWASVLVYQGKYAQGEPLMRECYEGFLKTRGADHSRTLLALMNLAETNALMGKLAESERMLRRVLQGQRAALGPYHAATLMTLENLTDGLEKQHRYPEASELLLELLEAHKKAKEPDAERRKNGNLRVRASLARVYQAMGEMEKALSFQSNSDAKLVAPPGLN